MSKTYDALSRIRLLSIALFLSGSFNILLLALHFYWAFQDKTTTTFVPIKPKMEAKSFFDEERLAHYRTLPLETLLAKLLNGEERDLVITALVATYDFDMRGASTALSPQAFLTRNGEKLVAYPDLKEDQIKLIQDFVRKEKWPLKAKGMFQLLKKGKQDAALLDAFFRTEEFLMVKDFFSSEIESKALLQVLIEGPWELLASFYQKKGSRMPTEIRAHFLMQYIKNGSHAAAALLVKTDWDFIINRLTDDTLYSVLKLLEKQDLVKLSSAIVTGSRSEPLRLFAQKILQEARGDNIHQKVLTSLKSKEPTPNLLTSKTYIVQEGDSLWKIAKKFNVDVENLKKINSLPTDLLQPGLSLQIPNN